MSAFAHLLSSLQPGDVQEDPFPHLVVRDALPNAVCRELVREVPPFVPSDIDAPVRDGMKYHLRRARAESARGISPVWIEGLRETSSAAFWLELLRVFGPSLFRAYPDFVARYGEPSALRTGLRGRDDFGSCDLLLDSKLLIHAPIRSGTVEERPPHLKFIRSLFLGELFLRHDDDTSAGAEFELFRLKDGCSPAIGARHSYRRETLQLVRSIPYERNVMIVFLNTPRSIQGVATRTASPYAYQSLHFSSHVRSDLFTPVCEPGMTTDPVPHELSYPPLRPGMRQRTSAIVRSIVGASKPRPAWTAGS